MPATRFKPEQIVKMLREADAGLSQNHSLTHVCRKIGITVPTYYRWKCEFGGIKMAQAKRLRHLEKENVRLKRAVAELIVDKLVLKEVLESNT